MAELAHVILTERTLGHAHHAGADQGKEIVTAGIAPDPGAVDEAAQGAHVGVAGVERHASFNQVTLEAGDELEREDAQGKPVFITGHFFLEVTPECPQGGLAVINGLGPAQGPHALNLFLYYFEKIILLTALLLQPLTCL